MFRWLREKPTNRISDTLPGKYSGWARHPDGEWEDLIGTISVVCQPTGDKTSVTINSVEFGAWQGVMMKDEASFRASTGQGGTFFLCAVRLEKQAEKVRTILEGAVWETPTKKLLDVQLCGELRTSTR